MGEQEIQSVKQRFAIIGNSPKLNYAIKVAMQVANTDLSVLITGESGSGKESFSKIIHQLSHRKHGSFIAINCGAIPEGTINSELFGHEKGAFTGASDSRRGYFEEVNKGTIFLDEIGETPLETQARLLRVLENQEFIRVGSSKVLKTDVRVVAATNVDLLDRIRKGKFREDLYYRLNTVPIHVPPLRERGDDIELLFRKFTTDFAEKHRFKPLSLNYEAKRLLQSFSFPGNIRQLKNIAEQMSVLEIEREIGADKMRQYLPKNEANRLPALLNHPDSETESFSDRDLLYKVLFEMKKDVNDLKKLVLEMLRDSSGDMNTGQIIQENRHLFSTIDQHIPAPEKPFEHTAPSERRPYMIGPPKESDSRTENTYEITDEDDTEDIIHQEEEEDTLSLQKTEKSMIIKALKKNNNKRKYAAQDLGISERTLYRKIKQYEI